MRGLIAVQVSFVVIIATLAFMRASIGVLVLIAFAGFLWLAPFWMLAAILIDLRSGNYSRVIDSVSVERKSNGKSSQLVARFGQSGVIRVDRAVRHALKSADLVTIEFATYSHIVFRIYDSNGLLTYDAVN
jgi:uncharacterized protein (DUF58 family)